MAPDKDKSSSKLAMRKAETATNARWASSYDKIAKLAEGNTDKNQENQENQKKQKKQDVTP